MLAVLRALCLNHHSSGNHGSLPISDRRTIEQRSPGCPNGRLNTGSPEQTESIPVCPTPPYLNLSDNYNIQTPYSRRRLELEPSPPLPSLGTYKLIHTQPSVLSFSSARLNLPYVDWTPTLSLPLHINPLLMTSPSPSLVTDPTVNTCFNVSSPFHFTKARFVLCCLPRSLLTVTHCL